MRLVKKDAAAAIEDVFRRSYPAVFAHAQGDEYRRVPGKKLPELLPATFIVRAGPGNARILGIVNGATIELLVVAAQEALVRRIAADNENAAHERAAVKLRRMQSAAPVIVACSEELLQTLDDAELLRHADKVAKLRAALREAGR